MVGLLKKKQKKCAGYLLNKQATYHLSVSHCCLLSKIKSSSSLGRRSNVGATLFEMKTWVKRASHNNIPLKLSIFCKDISNGTKTFLSTNFYHRARNVNSITITFIMFRPLNNLNNRMTSTCCL